MLVAGKKSERDWKKKNWTTEKWSHFIEIIEEDNRKCIDGKTYNDGCNNCFCTGGVTACTMMLCMDNKGNELPSIPPPEDYYEK